MTYSYERPGKEFGGGTGRILAHDMFLNLLDLEVKRSRRYQNFFCILVMRLNQLSSHDNGTHQLSCYQKLTHLLEEELRESDILGSLGDNCVAAILPYGDYCRRRHNPLPFRRKASNITILNRMVTR